MTIQVIDKQKLIFRVNNEEYQFMKPNFLFKNFGTVIPGRVKGSTLGWNVEGGFLSYNKLKYVLKKMN